ncbi:hypothetical protein [Roseicitreum antarcticum]|uniref:Uncharacterized protein n=1 Tax=Roseicitreum antarcticum TaxID=564137 RepID=A0A1H2WDB1_9RHOB|nr:hypothetical protein [Roseicitreum antarcticum]SDW78673.1 hypothetical protein SAMN04488238_103349 [Roseicitreum antarcticum]
MSVQQFELLKKSALQPTIDALTAATAADVTAATTARTGAETAQGAAETARTGSEAARDASLAARDATEGFLEDTEAAAALATVTPTADRVPRSPVGTPHLARGWISPEVIPFGIMAQQPDDQPIPAGWWEYAAPSGGLRMINNWQPQALGAGVVDLSRLDLAYTDTAGTVLAQPGQKVQTLRDGNGAIVAAQAADPSRSIYGRHPASGIRNQAHGSASTDVDSFWNPTSNTQGVTITRVSAGVNAQGPWAVYSVVGTAINDSFTSPFLGNMPRAVASPGQVWTTSFFAQIVGGTPPPAGNGVRAVVFEESAGATQNSGSASAAFAGTDLTLVSHTRTFNEAYTVQARGPVDIRTLAGETVDYQVFLQAHQLEQGASRTAYQYNFNQFNITEEGQRSVYYLKPDGIDDWMQLVAPFSAGGGYTLAAAISRVSATRFEIFSNHPASTTRFGVTPGTQAVLLAYESSNRREWFALPPGDFDAVLMSRVSEAGAAEFFYNGEDSGPADVAMGDVTPMPQINALFRFGGFFASGRFYGGVLAPAAISGPGRLMLQRYLASIGGISL